MRGLTLAFLLSTVTVLPVFTQAGSLKVGAARVDVTPNPKPEDFPPTGRFAHERLFVRAIVLDNGVTRAVLLSCDGNFGGDTYSTMAPLIAKELDCPPENIIMSATHSHSARLSASPNDAVMEAVRKAMGKLQPAKVGYGTGDAYLNVNRDAIDMKTRLWTQAANLEGSTDKTLAIIMFTDLMGEPIAAYMNYAMHPINGYLTGITSADFPGAACRHIEQAFGDNPVVVFTQGASGDQNPLWLRPSTNVLASKSDVKIAGFEMVREEIEAPLREGKVTSGKPDPEVAEVYERWVDALGMLLGEEAIRIMTHISELDQRVRIQGFQETITLPGRKRTNSGREGAPGTYEDGPPVDLHLGLLGIGNIAVTSINAELYSVFGQHLKMASPMTRTMLVSMVNGRAGSGYIIDDASYGRNTFQVLDNKLKPGYAEQGVVGGLVKLIEQYMK